MALLFFDRKGLGLMRSTPTTAAHSSAGASRATVRDVADAAGVSLGTVSNFLNDVKPIAPATRSRIEKAIESLDFVPNRSLRTMRGGRTQAIGYVVSDSPDPFFVEVARGIEDVARHGGLVLVSCNTEGRRDHESQYVTVLAEMRVAGVIVLPSFEQSDLPFRGLRASGAAVVVLGEWDQETCSIGFNDQEGGRLAAMHLLELGHRHIVFLGGPGGESQVEHRFAGAQAAVRSVEGSGVSLRRIDATGSAISDRSELADRLLELEPRPTAVFCASDSLALAVLNGLLRKGIRVPHDIAIVGFNDIMAAQLAVVPLTTVSVPQYELGQRAAQLLLDELKPGHRHEQVIFEPSLVVRESTTG